MQDTQDMQDMQSKLDEAKTALLHRAAEVADRDRGSESGVADTPEGLVAFLRRYYRHVAAEDLVDREPADVYGAALSHRQLAGSRPQGTAKVRVFTPTADEHGWAADGHTVVEVLVNDMPFIVDSVTAELNRHGRAIHLVVHPQLVVRRDIAGRLLGVCDTSTPSECGDDALVESWMHVEIDRVASEEDQEQLAADLQRVLRDVREVVEDWPKMRGTALHIAEELQEQPPVGLSEQEVAEGTELRRWLADDHFTFMGYREYVLEGRGEDEHLRAAPASGLGILRADQTHSASFGRLPREVRERAREPHLLVLTKANSRSTVHRPAYLDYVGVKVFDEAGDVVGERRFLGLFTSATYNESIQRIPVVRRKAVELLARGGFAATSHSGKDLLQILETYPRDELFQISVDDLEPIMINLLHLQERRQLRLFLRRDEYGRFMSCLVYLPRDRYTTQVRQAMEQILLEAFQGRSIDYAALVSESVLARLHFVVRVDRHQAIPDVDPAEVERRLVLATRSWDDDFADALLESCGEEQAAELAKRYAGAFPEAYKEDLPARAAVADLHRLERLREPGDIDLSVYKPADAPAGAVRFKLFHLGEPVSLSLVLPRLQRMGVEVVDERPYEIERPGLPSAWIYDFGLRYDPVLEDRAEQARNLFQDAFAAVWSDRAESDGFNALVLRAGLTWRQAMVLRAYAKYLRQGGSTFSQDYIEECLCSNVRIAQLLVRLFEARFDPGYEQASAEVVDGLVEEITGALDAVESLDQDRILRSFLGAVRATLRTNYFQTGADGAPKPYVSF
ncbi:MAG: NAD-glutamate dehydrogenase domain-containing protein, partial [Nocardioidaceae bacterium]